jgi:quercetin dioxygenase-like cupin family protein
MREESMIVHVDKGWGYEKWIVNKHLYCGKLLFFEKGKKCSFHYHKLKDETFYLRSGKLIVRYSDDDNFKMAQTIVLNSGDKFYVRPELRHQMEALEDSELFEFSTEHFDHDSYRIVRGD